VARIANYLRRNRQKF